MSIQHDDQRILFLDLEGVMTRGYFGHVSMVAAFRGSRDGRYSAEATRYIGKLVKQHGFKIVLITRHASNDSASLQVRLRFAGIRPDWLYKPDPEAIPDMFESKGDPMMDWLARNPHIKIENTAAVDDNGIKTSVGRAPYPQNRVIIPDTEKGFTLADYVAVLRLMGDKVPELTPARTASQPPSRQAP